MIIKMHFRKLVTFVCLILTILLIEYSLQALTVESKTTELKTSGASFVSRIAPGEFLPISVKLINFGEGRRVDVTINYQIICSDNVVVLTESETVAVETTASFVKNIQIPNNFTPGKYIASSSIIYGGQEVPASSSFEFTVERKIAGIFVSQLIIYGIVTVLVGVIFAVLSRLIIKRRVSRFTPYEYSEVPKEERIFYEIVSDIIMQMRYRVGDQAIEIARNIEGLIIDKENGKVLEINKDPAEIVALLILKYQKEMGKKMRILPRKADEETKDLLRPIENHLNVIKKYFR